MRLQYSFSSIFLFVALLWVSFALPSLTQAEKTSCKNGSKVELYVTSWCPHCQNAERFLKEKRIRHTLYDIEKEKDGLRRYQELGGRGVPLLKVGTQILRGFDPTAVIEALNAC